MLDVDLEQWERKHCCFVLWEDSEEGLQGGTLQDMWDILWDVYTNKRGRGSPTTSSLPIFFIDQQSGHDFTLIAVEPDFLYTRKPSTATAAADILKDIPAAKARGFLYNRIRGRDVHFAHADLSIENMDIDEFVDEVHRFPRPRWPGHGILEDDN